MNSKHIKLLQRMANESWIGSPEHVALTAAIAVLSASAEAQPCGCGEATCTVPWEPGCGLGKSEQHAEAQAQGGGEDNQCDGCCAGYGERNGIHVLPDGTTYMTCQSGRYAPPSAPVGEEGLAADLETIWHSVSDDKETNAAYQRLKAALSQQTAAMDDAMVDLAVAGYAAGPWAAFSPEASRKAHRERMRAALKAALTQQPAPTTTVGVPVDVVREYLDARACYEAATRPPNSHARAPVLKHDDPDALRLREARVALDNAIIFAQQPSAVDAAMSPQVAREWLLDLMGDYDFTVPRIAFSAIVDALATQQGGES